MGSLKIRFQRSDPKWSCGIEKKSSRTVKTQILPNKARLPQTKNVEKSKSIKAAKATNTVKFAADFTEDEKCVHVSARSPNTHIKNKLIRISERESTLALQDCILKFSVSSVSYLQKFLISLLGASAILLKSIPRLLKTVANIGWVLKICIFTLKAEESFSFYF